MVIRGDCRSGLREAKPKMALGVMMQEYKPIFDRFDNGVPILPRQLDGKTVWSETVKQIEQEELAREVRAASETATGHPKTSH
jgi:hypothetical protein